MLSSKNLSPQQLSGITAFINSTANKCGCMVLQQNMVGAAGCLCYCICRQLQPGAVYGAAFYLP